MALRGTLTAELCSLIGEDATRTLIQHWGGGWLYIPKSPLGHPLSTVLGEDAARLLSEYFGGIRLAIPLGAQLALEDRNEAIRRDRAEGMSVPQLARKYRVSLRLVYYVVGSEPKPRHRVTVTRPQQMSLF